MQTGETGIVMAQHEPTPTQRTPRTMRTRMPAHGVKDPVCGMTVDPHTAKHRHTHDGQPYYFCSAGCREKFVADPAQYLEPEPRTARACAGRHDLHLPDASRDPAAGPGLVPDLRHGARAGDWSRPTRRPIPSSPT